MCAVSIIPAVISIAATAASQGIQAKMQSDAANRQAVQEERKERQNAAIAKAQGADAMQQGAEQAGKIESEGRRAQASTMAAMQKTGVEGGSMESLLDVSGFNAAADADRVRASAARQAWGFEAESDERLRRAKQARRAGHLGTLSAGVGAAGNIGRGMANQNWGKIASDIYNS